MAFSVLFIRSVDDRPAAIARRSRHRNAGLDGRRKKTQGEGQEKEINERSHRSVYLTAKTKAVNYAFGA
jgi:hypothetical protein